MKYFELMKYANNAAGAIFAYSNEEELEATKEKFNPDSVDEISEEEYNENLKRQNRKFTRMVTGYPK